MGPIDPRDNDVKTPETHALGLEAADSTVKTRVVVEIYPWYRTGTSGTAQVDPPPPVGKSTDSKTSEK
jgi:hypothetical protein